MSIQRLPRVAVDDWAAVNRNFNRLMSNSVLGDSSSPTFGQLAITGSIEGASLDVSGNVGVGGGVTIGNLTASRLLFGDSGKEIDSVEDLQSWIAGTANQIITADDGDGSITLSTPQNIHTGASPTFADLTLTTYDSAKVISEILIQTISPGVLETITVSDADGRNITWTAGEIIDFSGNIVVIQSGSGTCTNDAENHLLWASGTTLTLTTTAPTAAQIPVAHIAVAANDIWEIHRESLLNVLLHDIQHGTGEAVPLLVTSGCVVSEDTDATNPLDVSISAGEYYHDLHSEHIVAQMDSRTTPLRRWYRSGGNWTNDTNAQIDNTQWDNGTNLGGMTTNRYFRSVFVTSESEIHWIYPQQQFTTLAGAISGADPTLPTGLTSFPKCTVVIMRQGDTTFPTAGGDRWIDVRPTIGAEGTGVSIGDHGSLSGLGGDDHAQYLLVDGTRALTGAWDMGNQALTNVNIDTGDINVAVVNTEWDAAYSHSQLTSGNPHSVTPTELSLVIGTNTQAWDAGLDSLAGLSYVSASFVKMTGADTFALRTIAETADDLEGTIVHDNLASVHQDITTTATPTFVGVVSAGDLKLNPTATGDVILFGDSDVGNGDAGGQLIIHRRAAEFDRNFSIGHSASGNLRWIADAGNISIRTPGLLYLQDLADGNIECFALCGEGETNNFRIAGFPSGGSRDTVSMRFDSTVVGLFEFVGANNSYTFDQPIRIQEQAAAEGNIAGWGQLWIRNDGPNILMFSDDAGNDYTVNVTAVP